MKKLYNILQFTHYTFFFFFQFFFLFWRSAGEEMLGAAGNGRSDGDAAPSCRPGLGGTAPLPMCAQSGGVWSFKGKGGGVTSHPIHPKPVRNKK